MSNKKVVVFIVIMLSLVGIAGNASATEGGGGIYPNGIENFTIVAIPPSGVYLLAYAGNYNANSVRDHNGNQAGPPDFNLRVTSLVPRVFFVTGQTILGGQLVFHAIAPLLNMSVTAGGARQSSSGLGDITVGTGLGYHASDKFSYAFGLDVYAPTGSYDKNNLANLGRNYWGMEPAVLLTYAQPEGVNADLKVMYDFNMTNSATNYKSGQELHADYDMGWGFGNGFVAGVGGYAYRQTTDDIQNGATVANNRGKAFAIGPSIKYGNGKGWLITAKYQTESSVINRPQGQAFQMKMTIPF